MGDKGRNTSTTISHGAKHERSDQGDRRRQEPSAGETCHETGCVEHATGQVVARTILAPLESEVEQMPHAT